MSERRLSLWTHCRDTSEAWPSRQFSGHIDDYQSAARQHGAAELIDPREHAVGTIADTFAAYPHVGPLLPAMGYGRRQMKDLRATIRASNPDLVLIGTPIDLRRLIDLDTPALRVTYKLQEVGEPTLEDVLADRGLIEPAGALA